MALFPLLDQNLFVSETAGLRLLMLWLIICCVRSYFVEKAVGNLKGFYADLDLIYNRRIDDILAIWNNPANAKKWREELGSDNMWTDIDYTSGCSANRAVWKAVEHVRRMLLMASLWYRNQDEFLLSGVHSTFNLWLDNDYPNEDCLYSGGSSQWDCPCGTPGFWNQNWWWQIIQLPMLIGQACLLLEGTLTQSQLTHCDYQLRRSYDLINGNAEPPRAPLQIGANRLDVAYSGLSLALLTRNLSLLQDAVNHYYEETKIDYEDGDSIKVDGSFLAHTKQLLTGSYGEVFIRRVLQVFMETSKTFAAPPAHVQEAFLTLLGGSEWMCYVKEPEGKEKRSLARWQESVRGRSVARKYGSTATLHFRLDHVLVGTEGFGNQGAFQDIVERLQGGLDAGENGQSANPGLLIGTRYFWIGDYLVHRTASHIVTLKMYSTRTFNSECYNGENPFGFHLADGSIYTYSTGNEYTNIFGAWDWDLIPGITVDYGATNLSCPNVRHRGLESFVGAATLDNAGVAVMTYTNPRTKQFHWRKTYFFYPGGYSVQFVGDIQSQTDAPVYTVLEQRRHFGDVLVDGNPLTADRVTVLAQGVWDAGIGYKFKHPVLITVEVSRRRSQWEIIGASQGEEAQEIITIYAHHPPGRGNAEDFSYEVQLDVEARKFFRANRILKQQILPRSDQTMFWGFLAPLGFTAGQATVRGVSYGSGGYRIVSLAFWTAGVYTTGLDDIRKVRVDAPILLIFQWKESQRQGWTLCVADPSQRLIDITISVWMWDSQVPLELRRLVLPRGAYAGSNLVVDL